jgi:glycosyltransferase involved in cell wall biosynthesis
MLTPGQESGLFSDWGGRAPVSFPSLLDQDDMPIRASEPGRRARGARPQTHEASSIDSVSLSLVIPLCNEEENVLPLVEQLNGALAGWPGSAEMLLVDDGSSDATLDLLRRAQETDSRIRIIHFRRNLGQTAAMAAGFRLARGNAVVTLDGDLQNDPKEIPRLVEMLKDWDAVCGIRIHREDGRWKRLSSRIGNGFRNWVTGDNIVDTGCTLKAYRRECLQCLELYNGMHRFLPTLLKMRGFRVTQVPVSHRPRLHGRTKYATWGRLVKGLGDVLAVRWMKKNRIDLDGALEAVERTETSSQESAARGQKVELGPGIRTFE